MVMSVSEMIQELDFNEQVVAEVLKVHPTNYYVWRRGSGSPTAANKKLLEVMVWTGRLGVRVRMLSDLPEVKDLAEWRKHTLRMSQEAVSKLLGVNRQTWVNWEYGTRSVGPSVHRLVQCIEWLRVNNLLPSFTTAWG